MRSVNRSDEQRRGEQSLLRAIKEVAGVKPQSIADQKTGGANGSAPTSSGDMNLYGRFILDHSVLDGPDTLV